jgi:hypothetical protein
LEEEIMGYKTAEAHSTGPSRSRSALPKRLRSKLSTSSLPARRDTQSTVRRRNGWPRSVPTWPASWQPWT